jgi:hypothetical protein
VLERIAQVPGGVLSGPAPNVLARELGASTADCFAEIQELQTDDFVRVEDGSDGNRRLVANYVRLGHSLAGVQAVALQRPPFDVLDPRGSAEVMENLRRDLQADAEPVCLAFDWAAPAEFPDLWARAGRQRKTVVLVPPKRALRDRGSRELYEDSVKEWRRHLKQTRDARDYIDFRVTRRPAPQLYGGWWSPGSAGLSVVSADASQGPGAVIRAEPESSLYTVLQQDFARTFSKSDPLFAVWPGRWLLSRLVGVPSIVGLLLALTLLLVGNLAVFLATMAAGLAANAITVPDSVARFAKRKPPIPRS